MTTYTLRIVDPADDPDKLAAALGELEARGYRVECDALAGQMRRRSRDEYLRQAHALMSGTPWGRCVQLEAEIHRFEALVWPRWRDRAAPPEPCSKLRSLLFRARQCGPLPGVRQLHNIIAVKRNALCDFREKPVQSPPDPE